nr:reverse transcriptase domain-containing protein [Tanacetum cinerariifolium]
MVWEPERFLDLIGEENPADNMVWEPERFLDLIGEENPAGFTPWIFESFVVEIEEENVAFVLGGNYVNSAFAQEFKKGQGRHISVAKEDNMIKYLEIAKGLVSGFKTFSISQVPRSRNKKADALSKIASTSFAHLSKQLEHEHVVMNPTQLEWELVNYLKEGILPGDEKEARKLRLKARQYDLMEGVLYKRSFLTPWLRCVGPLQAEYVMKKIHEGLCSMHAGPRVRGVAFKPGDFVYRSNDASHAVAGGKLGPKWEGPYEVIDALENGAYKLRSTDETVLPRTWNVTNLKRCYL